MMTHNAGMQCVTVNLQCLKLLFSIHTFQMLIHASMSSNHQMTLVNDKPLFKVVVEAKSEVQFSLGSRSTNMLHRVPFVKTEIGNSYSLVFHNIWIQIQRCVVCGVRELTKGTSILFERFDNKVAHFAFTWTRTNADNSNSRVLLMAQECFSSERQRWNIVTGGQILGQRLFGEHGGILHPDLH